MSVQRTKKLHRQLVDFACANDGWQTGNWREAFAAKTKDNPHWDGEFGPSLPPTPEEIREYDLDPDDTEELQSELADVIGDDYPEPDAWRLVVEGPETLLDDAWSYDVLVLEFLEVELGEVDLDTISAYNPLWWAFDESACFFFRVHLMDGQGRKKVLLDTLADALELDDGIG